MRGGVFGLKLCCKKGIVAVEINNQVGPLLLRIKITYNILKNKP
jgi:hypothetical protein